MYGLHLYDAFVGHVHIGGDVPNITERLDWVATRVSVDLSEMDMIYPNETPMHLLSELVDSAVTFYFPDWACNDRLAQNDRYNRILTRVVGKRAFTLLGTYA